MQPDLENGIEFLIKFVNEGRNVLEMGDVTNALNLTAFRTTEPGGHVIPSWSPHRFGAPVYTTEFPDEAEIRAEALAAKRGIERARPYRVAEPTVRTAKVRTLRDIRDTEDVRLKPGESFQMIVRITEGIADPAEYWWNLAELSKELGGSSLPSVDPSDLAPLPAGQYGLSLWASVSVGTPRDDETAPTRWHALLFCDAIPIRLGE